MQKMIAFYNDKNDYILKLGCTLPNLDNICLHNSIDAKFYPFTQGDKDLLQKFEKMLLLVHLSFLRWKQLSIKLSFENQEPYANLLSGSTIANYTTTRCLNPCRPVCICFGISIQKRADLVSGKTRPAALKIWSCPNFNEQYQNVKLKASLQQADGNKLTALMLMGFYHWNFVFEALGCFYHFCSCQEVRLSLTEEYIQRGRKKREFDALRRPCIQEKGFTVFEIWECEWWRLYKITNTVKQHTG